MLKRKVINYVGGCINVSFNDADQTPVEVMIYQDIGDDPWGSVGFTARDFIDALEGIEQTRPLDLRINSAGGSVWEGMAIKTRLDEWKGKKTASIDGMAASVASWLPMGVDEIRAPRHAQMFIHPAWGLAMGNASQMRQQADELDKTTGQIADIYARKTRMSRDECLDLMNKETLMTAEEAHGMGFIDKLTDGDPVSNFTEAQIRNMKQRLAALNSLRTPLQGGNQNTKNIHMKRNQIEALLNKLGVKFNKEDTDAQLLKLLADYTPPKNKVTFKNGKDGEHADDCDCEDCSNSRNAPAPKTPEEGEADDDESAAEGELFKAATANMKGATAKLDNFLLNERRKVVRAALNRLAEESRIQVNSIPAWEAMALTAAENENGENPILNQLSSLPAIAPGREPLNIEVGEPSSLDEVGKAVEKLQAPSNYFNRNSTGPENLYERMLVARNSTKAMQLTRSLMQYDRKHSRGMISPLDEASGGPALIGPLRKAWDSWANGLGPRNANTIAAGLQRQVILSEAMRAFRRQFASLEIFAHNFGSIPLEGTDYVQVPYYPLDTVASSEFTYANGYQINPNTQTLSKNIFVGGIGNGVASGGSGRKYKALQFTAYQIRRQPWLDVQKLSVMAGEQLAIDVRADILGTWVNAANFANAIWTGAPGGFDHTVVGNVLLQAAIAAFWPLRGRNVVLSPGYYTNLAIDPGITPLLAIGTTDILREGIVGGLYGFENIIHDPKLPVANFIQGGSGANANGTDPYSAGFMAWPSAILIATAPIMPPPGVLKKLVAYEQITDDQTGLAFTYQFFGNETSNVDNEIIECTYGSGLGELAALFRLTSQGA